MKLNKLPFFTPFLFLFFLLRAILVWYGFDRLPLVSSNDEAIVNDPALSLSEGRPFVARSYEGLLKLDKVYGHYPPVYPLLQAIIFRLFGFSTFTLRATNIIFFELYTLLLIILFYRLRNLGIFDDFALFWVTILLLTDPTLFRFARFSRPDSLGLFLGITAFALLISNRGLIRSKKRWILGGIFIGLSISTHFSMSTLWVIYIIVALLIWVRQNLKFTILLLATPLFVFTCICLFTHRMKSWEAIMQFWQIRTLLRQPGGNMLACGIVFLKAMLSADRRHFMNYGGHSLLLVIFSWLIIFTRLFLVKRKQIKGNDLWQRWLLTISIISLAHFLMIAFAMDLLTQRTITILPAALVGLGVALTHLRLSLFSRYLINGICTILMVIGLVGHGLYLAIAYTEWEQRDPRRFLNFVKEIPLDKRVATYFPLWFEFMKSGHRVRVLSTGIPKDLDSLLEKPEILSKFDVVIAHSEDPSNYGRALFKALSNRSSRVVIMGGKSFIVFEK